MGFDTLFIINTQIFVATSGSISSPLQTVGRGLGRDFPKSIIDAVFHLLHI